MNLEKELELYKKDKLNKCKKLYERKRKRLIDVPELEYETWGTQVTEANRYLLDNSSANVPLIATLASTRGMSVSELVSRIKNNESAFIQGVGHYTGLQHAKEDEINACLTKENVINITLG